MAGTAIALTVDEPSEVISSTGTRYRIQRDLYGFAVVCEDGSFGHTSGVTFDADAWERRFQAFRNDPVWAYARERERELRALTDDSTEQTTRQPQYEREVQILTKGEKGQAGK